MLNTMAKSLPQITNGLYQFRQTVGSYASAAVKEYFPVERYITSSVAERVAASTGQPVLPEHVITAVRVVGIGYMVGWATSPFLQCFSSCWKLWSLSSICREMESDNSSGGLTDRESVTLTGRAKKKKREARRLLRSFQNMYLPQLNWINMALNTGLGALALCSIPSVATAAGVLLGVRTIGCVLGVMTGCHFFAQANDLSERFGDMLEGRELVLRNLKEAKKLKLEETPNGYKCKMGDGLEAHFHQSALTYEND